MPWEETSVVERRKEFVDAYMAKEETVTELCRLFSISRKTGYKWIGRFLGSCELEDRSRRPHTSPRKVADWIEDAIVRARKLKPRWGPRKLRAALARSNPGVDLPSVSTFALIFTRNGLITPRKRRRKVPASKLPLAHADAPNKVWCMDFKGDFLVGKARCYPLTVTDAYSRYLLACVALPSTKLGRARRALESVFDAFGLPESIRTDNGVPFASAHAPAGLSELSAWWHKLGIRHERIEPGKPQQNGRHERMHLTLKLDTAMPPRTSMRAQQRAFDRFRKEYNETRPHEALSDRVPAEFYERSRRRAPGRLSDDADFNYPEDFETVRVSKTGRALWNGRGVFLSAVLRHQLLGLEWNENGDWIVYFGTLRIGMLSRKGKSLRFVPTEASPRKTRT